MLCKTLAGTQALMSPPRLATSFIMVLLRNDHFGSVNRNTVSVLLYK